MAPFSTARAKEARDAEVSEHNEHHNSPCELAGMELRRVPAPTRPPHRVHSVQRKDGEENAGYLKHKGAREPHRRFDRELVKLLRSGSQPSSLLRDGTCIRERNGNTPVCMSCARLLGCPSG